MSIIDASKKDYIKLIDIWEKSVKATHDFLPESEIQFLKPLILNNYFDAVDLKIYKSDNEEYLGFIGVADSNIEMLFVHPYYFGKGIGRKLTDYATQHLGASKVDVNEDNLGALNFYKKVGFKVVDRSPLDGQGKPYPILHLTL